MNRTQLSLLLTLVGALSLMALRPASAWAPKQAPLMTKWAKDVDPKKPWPEYPRPQLARSQWQNLNGVWEFQPGQEGDALPTNTKLSGEICVPFPVESALSGVMEHHDRLWYRRRFSVPAAWQGKPLMLNFGAVDYEAEVFVNGQSVGIHRGGYEPFSFDVSDFVKSSGPQELIVRVFDPTDKGGQPRGKQTLNPGGIMYSPTSGIWQTVWLEPVEFKHIHSLHMVPDIDKGQIKVMVDAGNTGITIATRALVTIRDGGKIIQKANLQPGVVTAIPIPNAKLWSPDSPFLYDVDVQLMDGKRESDRVSSYFGMRKISLGKVDGITKILLNNRFVFQTGPLDQGFWPDGIYTAPTDEALKSDLVAEKQMGFNMVRKHIKVEPARWYYHADKLGIMVWQDMPSPNSYLSGAPPVDKQAFEKQEENVIRALWNSPAIIMWVLINEGQGAYDQAKFVSIAQRVDPSRLVNRHSGGGNDGPGTGDLGDVDDVHTYPAPQAPNPSPNQAIVCGEYGGIGFPLPGHTWTKGNWGYTTVSKPQDLEEQFGEYTGMLKRLRDEKGMSAAVYTQISDVEAETNGLLTYDRILKADPNEIARANHFQYPQPTYVAISPTSDVTSQTWKYTTNTPPATNTPLANWTQLGFDDANWQTGTGAFGNKDAQNGPRISTEWTSSDLYLRKTFNPGNLSASEIQQFMVRNLHDDEVEVFINGVRAFQNNDAVHVLEDRAMSEEAKRAIVPNATNILAVHCHNRFGDQHVDVGIYRRVLAVKKVIRQR